MDQTLALLGSTPGWLQALLGALLVSLVVKYGAAAVAAAVEYLVKTIRQVGEAVNGSPVGRKLDIDDFILEHLVEVVLGVQDSVVDALKAAAEDGKLDEKDITNVSEITYNRFKDSVGKWHWDRLAKVAGDDLKKLIIAKIPGVVAKLKVEGAIASDTSSVAAVGTEFEKDPIGFKEEE